MIQTVTPRKRRRLSRLLGPLRYLLPVAYVHHNTWSYGYVLFPWFRKSLGYMNFGGGISHYRMHFGYSEPVFKKGFKLVNREDCHNCTWTGVY